jgi:hypothetical protein
MSVVVEPPDILIASNLSPPCRDGQPSAIDRSRSQASPGLTGTASSGFLPLSPFPEWIFYPLSPGRGLG